MSAAETRFRSARRHLEVFEESWKADHEEAMRCRDFEAFLAEAAMVFRLLDRACRRRRDYVFRGVEEPSSLLDDMEKQVYVRWLRLADSQAEHLASLEKNFGMVEGAAEFQECRAQARATLESWTPAVPSLAPGSRRMDLSEEDADQIRGLLAQSEPGAGRPARPPRPIPPGDPALLR